MNKCPYCGEQFEPCELCRGQVNHQQCVDGERCHACEMDRIRRQNEGAKSPYGTNGPWNWHKM